jgi:hypothetical protein
MQPTIPDEVKEKEKLFSIDRIDAKEILMDSFSIAGGTLFAGIKDWGVFLNSFTINKTINSISGNILIYSNPMGNAAIEVAEKGSKVLGIGLFILSDIIAIVENFSNHDLSVSEKVAYTGVDLAFNTAILALSFITFPYGLIFSVAVSLVVELTDARGLAKKGVEEWWNL